MQNQLEDTPPDKTSSSTSPSLELENPQKRPNNKVTWLLVYGASGPSITHPMLQENTLLVFDECYTTTDSANKYTLLHLIKKVRETAVDKAMRSLSSKFGIILNGVFGYDLINSNTSKDPHTIRGNALYKWMVQSFQTKKEAFHIWISPLKTRKTLFSENMESPVTNGQEDLMRHSKRKLARIVFELRALNTGQSAKAAHVSGHTDNTSAVTEEEYDVVKKQRSVDMASEFAGADVSSAVIGSTESAQYFQAFSQEVFTWFTHRFLFGLLTHAFNIPGHAFIGQGIVTVWNASR
jgi:hypothetical protein